MHETSLMKGLMRQIDSAAVADGARRIVGISVWLGALCNMSAEHFAEHFEHAALGTMAEGASVDVTVSDDTQHTNAQDVLLQNIEVET